MYEKVVEINDSFSAKMFEHQSQDNKSKYYGGIIDPIMGVARPSHGNTPRVIAAWVASIVNPDSNYFHNKELVKRLSGATDYMLNNQHSDGTISLGATNYHSPPDTGFVVVGLSQVYQVLNMHEWEQLKDIRENIRLFLKRSIPALLTGGGHTPNHRWVITAALSFLYRIFSNEELLIRAEQWLAEGLDYTADGEWTERSNGIYNAVSNLMLYHAARNLERPELLEPIRKNLDLMQYLVHPSGEVVTDYSGRQDFGTTANLSNYYLIYRLMAHCDKNRTFAYMADLALEKLVEPSSVDNNAMIGHLLFPLIREETIERKKIPNEYVKIINETHPRDTYLQKLENTQSHMNILHSSPHLAFGSPIVRYKKENTSATIMTNTPSILSLRHGSVRLLGTKITTAFSPGVVDFDEFKEIQGGYRLKKILEKGYHGPVPSEYLSQLEKVEENITPWYLLPHHHRPITHLQKHLLTVDIFPGERSWDIHLTSDKHEEIFTQVTFIFGKEGQFSGEHLKAGSNPDQFFLTRGTFKYSAGNDSITISNGAYEHWIEVLNKDHHSPDCKHVSVNLMTPIDTTFKLTLN
ncbi:hypothetical protein [Bacillus solitudinis]|uniref:hypothetical protein n=1 Tax=Bacillus solitudinis TaxID=2014074 RepID=UPI000C243C4D|nr:hypothetical protein [Bacillus solitudinis]